MEVMSATPPPRGRSANSCRTSSPIQGGRRRSSGRSIDSLSASKDFSLPNQVNILSNLAPGSASLLAPTSSNRPMRGTASATGLLPLSPIMASSICTPSISMASSAGIAHPDMEDNRGTLFPDNQQLNAHLSDMNLPPPTRLFILPTPPHTLIRRSATCVSRKSRTLGVTQPAMFPVMLTNQTSNRPRRPKRSASAPTIKLKRSLSISIDTKSPPIIVELQDEKTKPTRKRVLFPASFDDDSRSTSRSRTMFHIPAEPNSDSESVMVNSGHEMHISQEANSLPFQELTPTTGDSSDDSWTKQKEEDETRRYHALIELLSTEVGYLMDLRAFVSIYLRQMPSLSLRPVSSITSPTSVMTFVRHQTNPGARPSTANSATSVMSFGRHSPGSYLTLPRFDTYTSISGHSTSSASTRIQPDGHSIATTPFTAQGKDKTKHAPRHLLSEADVEKVTRNAQDILQLHELFVEELRAAVMPFGYSIDSEECQASGSIADVEVAIREVTTKFTTEASRFNSYQQFCSGHPEALNLIRKIQQQHPTEWEAFERRCSSLVSKSPEVENKVEGPMPLAPVSAIEKGNPLTNSPTTADDDETRKRTRSLSSLDGPARSLRGQLARTVTKASSSVHTESGSLRKTTSSRLVFTDYMIKPIQRICKYPLLLDQLKYAQALSLAPSTPRRSDVNVVVESALQAMRHVARAVDEARHRQDVAMQSALIVSRIALAPSMNASSANGGSHPLTPHFLSSLGACLLAGSLDVIHYPANGASAKVKYLGAFLYVGGYFILAKVCKGQVYEPRYWFSLVKFNLSDVDDEEAILSCSFRLLGKGHRFEMGAACQREKEAWMNAIHESLQRSPVWTSEPASGLKFNDKNDLVQSPAGVPFETSNALPTIQSIPELGDDLSEPENRQQTLLEALREYPTERKGPKLDPAVCRDLSRPPIIPSRRSSNTSVKGIFSPMASESSHVTIRRISNAGRTQVDQGLRDVLSQICSAARAHARSHEEELFRPSKFTRGGFSSSNSGLSMVNAMGMNGNRVVKYETVRAPRRKSLPDGFELLDEVDALPVMASKASRALSLASRRKAKKMKIVTSPTSEDVPVEITSADSYTMVDLPLPPSRRSSNSFMPNPDIPPGRTPDNKPKRTSSMVDNMRGIFQTAPTSPAMESPLPAPGPTVPTKSSSSGIFKRWVPDSSPRRVLSSPEVSSSTPHPVATISAPPTSLIPDRSTALDLEFGSLALSRSINTSPPPVSFSVNSKTRRTSLFSGLRRNIVEFKTHR